ncbi:MAG: indole-3-glycerol phosphate synthase TrpC [Oscillospiraceae bacterium]|nr:indole-3-glycerol phosphate synthase TrpC [Oscillospiraceae bacterium]
MILDEIADTARRRVADAKAALPLDEVRERAEKLAVNAAFPFEKALKRDGISFICEVKRTSPSRGVIAEDFPYLDIAAEYAAAGADAISVLTEPQYFFGRDEYLREISAGVPLPTLRKDFVVDAYQIYEAKTLGAAAVLLICAILTPSEVREYLEIAHALGLSALVEAHTEDEVKTALDAGARIVGVNNRDLKTFTVDTATSAHLGKLIPRDVIFVSESGISTTEDVRAVADAGANAVLIGEAIMRAPDKRRFLANLRAAGETQ